jgi:hypothetical protein
MTRLLKVTLIGLAVIFLGLLKSLNNVDARMGDETQCRIVLYGKGNRKKKGGWLSEAKERARK